jgi:hypothetical protein
MSPIKPDATQNIESPYNFHGPRVKDVKRLGSRIQGSWTGQSEVGDGQQVYGLNKLLLTLLTLDLFLISIA